MDPLVFYFWGHMKSMMYETSLTSDMNLIARIEKAAARVRGTPDQFERVQKSMCQRYKTCYVANGRNFEHLLGDNDVL